ncbi:MAG: hypothetical protein Q8933_09835 [Bacteroidota bacterium]|nr:hypothetical protein [Bacteroidota bacterium]MDP4190722.1 hypothetical protein [Bacteroidota bacterium]MDP4196487.1 hypothetical protein [Bacteroidota bacterium]
MSFNIKQHIEKKFREATSSGELFDTFQQALKLKLKDIDLYKILLGNMALNADEIKMFTEKLCREFEDLKYDLYMWSANILENTLSEENLEAAFAYYLKASELDRTNHLPFMSILKMYNVDFDLPPKEKIISIIENAINEVKIKSHLFREMADFYGYIGDEIKKRKCLTLAAQYKRRENMS